MKKLNRWITLFMNPTRKVQRLLAVSLVSLTLLITLLVYVTGGIQYVYSHSMYVPILLAGIYLGVYGGIIQGFISGLLLGPFMPIDTDTMLMQSPINWIYRIVFFMLIGGTIGYFSKAVKLAYLERIKILKKDIYTEIPLFTNLLDKDVVNHPHYIMHLKILNHQDLIDLLGIDAYHTVLKMLQARIIHLEHMSSVYQKELSSFIIILEEKVDESTLEHLSDTLRKTFIVKDIPIFIDTALGITESSEDLHKSLIEAMYAARYAERHYLSYVNYKDTMTPNHENINILGLFKKALYSDELYLVFQPQINLKTGEIIGAEALTRWHSDELGLMMPDDFIPLIEETSLINDLTEWVIKSTFERIKMLMQSRIPIKIAINISAKNLLDKNFYTNVKSWLDNYQISGKYVEFEITEQSLMLNKGISKQFIEQLHHEKISLSIDDFGTGYSSLNELNRYQIHTLKIDQSFIHKCNEDARLCSITEAAINLGRALNIKTTAEGVETEEEVNYLKSIHCDYAQGYYYAKPLAFDDFYAFIKTHKKT
ncbi:MAG: putative bifunctional diguanylate cyclase/phosphodiesterase [Bacillota bacterium]